MAGPHPTAVDAYKPAEIAGLVDASGVAKARMPVMTVLTLAVLAGAFIALGAAAYTAVMTGADPGFGPARFLGGVVFSLGLILVVIAGAELFTGNALMTLAAVDRRISIAELLRNWLIVYAGNFAGALLVVALVWLAGLVEGPMATTAAAIAEGKAALGNLEAAVRGVLCNILVCLAVWLSIAARTVVGKVHAIVWPVAAFVLLGLEHSVANMYLLPQGMFAGADLPAGRLAEQLAFVTLGNVVGGAGGVALAYRLAYGSATAR